MKFHCDSCKTKYSISDDRVRGKILKIRCKKCSAVITVREPEKQNAQKRVATKNKPVSTPVPQDSPESFETEWYVSKDGRQEGPYTLKGAQDWIRRQTDLADLYCWSDGFDDWLPVEKVSQFRKVHASSVGAAPSLRRRSSSISSFSDEEATIASPSLAAFQQSAGGQPEETSPESLFASAMGKSSASNSSSAQLSAGLGADIGPDPLEFDIGEASRVVDLPMLLAQRGNAPIMARSTAGGLPGMAQQVSGGPELATSSNAQIQSQHGFVPGDSGHYVAQAEIAPVLTPAIPERGSLVPLLIACGAVVILGSGVMLWAVGGSDDSSQIARGSVSGNDTLGYRYIDERKPKETTTPTPQPRPKPRNTGGNNKSIFKRKPITPVSPQTKPNTGEVDLGGRNQEEAAGPLGGDDLMKVYQKYNFLITKCHEDALKKDPFLKVPKTWVNIEVGLTGRVTKVTIPSLAGTRLGNCLVARIKRWKFRRTTEVFNSRFPVVFSR